MLEVLPTLVSSKLDKHPAPTTFSFSLQIEKQLCRVISAYMAGKHNIPRVSLLLLAIVWGGEQSSALRCSGNIYVRSLGLPFSGEDTVSGQAEGGRALLSAPDTAPTSSLGSQAGLSSMLSGLEPFNTEVRHFVTTS